MLEFLSLFMFPFFGTLKSESYPAPLTDIEEMKYLKEMKNGSKEARNKLIEHNLRLVAHIAKKYDHTFEDKDDILSIGMIGLIKAVDSYNFNATNKLGTYAAKCIENEILMHLRSNKNKRNYTRLSNPIGEDKDGNQIELLDVVKDPSKPIDEVMCDDENKVKLSHALKFLSHREYDIISCRYGLDGKIPETQKEIAKKLNISRSYVSRIEKRALMKLYFKMISE